MCADFFSLKWIDFLFVLCSLFFAVEVSLTIVLQKDDRTIEGQERTLLESAFFVAV